MLFHKPGSYRVLIVTAKGVAVLALTLVAAAAAVVFSRPETDLKPLRQEIAELRKQLDDSETRHREQLAETRRAVTELGEPIKATAASVNAMRKNLFLLGALHNENFAATRAGRADQVIFIERDWTINRLPQHLDMTRVDVDRLSEYLRKEAEIAPAFPRAPVQP